MDLPQYLVHVCDNIDFILSTGTTWWYRNFYVKDV